MRKSTDVTKTFKHNGKRYYVVGATEKEAYFKMAEKIRKLENDEPTVDSSMTLSNWAKVCVSTYKSHLKDISLYTYKNRMQSCILNQIGYMKLKNIKPLDCQLCLNALSDKSTYTIKQTYQMLIFLFERAIQNGLLRTNPALYLSKPKGKKGERRALTPKEREIFLKACDLDPKYNIFLLTYYCGCRPTEAINCMGSDILMIDGAPFLWIRGTKSANANRKVPIPDIFYQRIKNTAKNKPIAVSTVGKKLTDKQRQLYWNALKREMNIMLGCKMYRNELIPPFPWDETICHYSLRHDYATRLAQNIPITQAKYLLGHSDISVTSNIYQHLDQTMLDIPEILKSIA